MSASRPHHRGDLQGLRAVAVLLVALGHAGVPGLEGGFVGVDVFFVLSGFLITGLLLAEARANGSVSLVDFYVRRARRILPAAALTLVVTDVAAWYLLNFIRARDAVHDSLYAAGFAANLRFAARGTDYFAQSQPPSPLLHFWSLSVEEQFYFAWPVLLSIVVLGAARKARRELRVLFFVGLLGGLSLAWSVHQTATLPEAAYFSPFTRAWELALGAALAAAAGYLSRLPARTRAPVSCAGLLAIAAAALVYSEETPFPGYAALLPTVGAALVICAGMTAQAGAGRLLAARPMRFVGDRSYAFYLWHWPALVLAEEYAGRKLPVADRLGLLAGAFALSCLSYGLVENPLRRGSWSRRATGLLAAASVTAVLVTAALSLAAVGRQEARFESAASSAPLALPPPQSAVMRSAARAGVLPEVVAAVLAARRGDAIPSGLTPPIAQVRGFPARYALPGCIPNPRSSQTTSRICRVGRMTSRRTILLLGDSHAEMWIPALLAMADRDGWAVIPLVRTGCPPATWVTGQGHRWCRPWFRWAARQVRRLRPTVTLVTGRVDETPSRARQNAVDGLLAMARSVGTAGRVVVIGDPESLDRDPVDCLLSRHASMTTCTTAWPASSLVPYDVIAAHAGRLGLGFIATRGWFCYQRQCPAVIGRTIVYRDNNHVGAAYSLGLAGPFRAAFLRATR